MKKLSIKKVIFNNEENVFEVEVEVRGSFCVKEDLNVTVFGDTELDPTDYEEFKDYFITGKCEIYEINLH